MDTSVAAGNPLAYVSTDRDEVLTAAEDIETARDYLGQLRPILDRMLAETTKSGRDAIRTEAEELIGSIHARMARAGFGLVRS